MKNLIALAVFVLSVIMVSGCNMESIHNILHRDNSEVANPEVVTAEADVSVISKVVTPSVYIASSGKKYHKLDCRYIVSEDQYTEMNLKSAKESGYTSCKTCKPE